MLIALILLYCAIQMGVALGVRRYLAGSKYNLIRLVVLLALTLAWTRVVDLATIYAVVPNKYGVVLYNPIPLMIAAMLAILTLLHGESKIRNGVYAVLGFAVNIYFFGTAFYNPIQCQDRWDGICCLQTTDSTCAAAAAATLLSLDGYRADESEMKDRCLSGFRGTSIEGLYHGMRDKLDGTGHQIEVAKLTCDEFLAQNEPAIIYVMLTEKTDALDKRYSQNWGWMVGTTHATVYLGRLDATHVKMADPGTGVERWNIEALQKLWRNTAIFIR